jgi:hypothetical protein
MMVMEEQQGIFLIFYFLMENIKSNSHPLGKEEGNTLKVLELLIESEKKTMVKSMLILATF